MTKDADVTDSADAPPPTPSPGKRRNDEDYRCQFCEQESPAWQWRQRRDHCPKCKRAYDPMLAQEGDD